MSNPLENIKDGYEFQQIIAEYFRSLKHEKHDYHISDIQVEDNGVGGDDGCDIFVVFYFEDPIYKHAQRWVVECKSQKRAVSHKDINSNNIDTVLKSKNANGYLLVCKYDATASLKRIFKEYNRKNNYQYIIWNGSQLWHKCIKSLSIIEAFFPKYYKENYLTNNAINEYNSYIKIFKEKLEKEGAK